MANSDSHNKTVSWEELLESISTANQHPEDTSWKIFRHLQQHYKTLGSVEVRTLLLAYIKLHTKTPSLLNSCMLGMALKISETYSDFNLPNFLKAWGDDSCLRSQDLKRETGKDGRQYLSLKERTERALQSYMLHHPDENKGECEGIASMYAVRVFEKETNGRKHHFVKLVAPDGSELLADSHQFPCRPWEICGHMFDILTRISKQGKERATEIVLSRKRVEEVFTSEVGFVEYIDLDHGHIHVYDAQSRHFVAGQETVASSMEIIQGCFVRFCPIIVNGDHFKSAAIVSKMDKYQGRAAFGTYEARVDYVNTEENYLRYTLESAISATPEGVITPTGYASTAALPAEMKNGIVEGSHVHLTLFLKRGKDGAKHNYVAELF